MDTDGLVMITCFGSCYHLRSHGGQVRAANPTEWVSRATAERQGFVPCSFCFPRPRRGTWSRSKVGRVHPRAECPVCTENVAIRLDGRLRSHPNLGGFAWKLTRGPCSGSGTLAPTPSALPESQQEEG